MYRAEEVAKINEYVCTGKRPEEQRSGDRNDDTDNGGEPPAPLCVDGENGAKPTKQKGKANRNTSKKKTERRKKNRGKLFLDAAVAPADIKYPTDIDLLNQCREHLETAVNKLWQHVPHSSHKLPYSAKKARKSYLKLANNRRKCTITTPIPARIESLAWNNPMSARSSAVLADKIYQTRSNKLFCSERGIRIFLKLITSHARNRSF